MEVALSWANSSTILKLNLSLYLLFVVPVVKARGGKGGHCAAFMSDVLTARKVSDSQNLKFIYKLNTDFSPQSSWPLFES